MNVSEVMEKLASLGNEQARKTYVRHGITGKAFGVRYGDLYKLVKQIGTDPRLADQLWETENHDAQVLALMIADPESVKASVLDRWVKQANNSLLADAVAKLAAKTGTWKTRHAKWIKSKNEWVAACGWHVLSAVLAEGSDAAEADELRQTLAHIEESIHSSPNRVRYAMNNAVISIGGLGGTLQREAIACAKRIGKVDVDHGDTSCKTPDAVEYIKKMADHRKKKADKAKSRRKVASRV